MTTARIFCRFNRGNSLALGVPDTTSLTVKEIPGGGFCMSAFLVATQRNDSKKVLMGHLDPNGSWDHIGALDEQRIKLHGNRWMLPSSHLIYGESPNEAAERIAREQLGFELKFGNPKVVSEVYIPKNSTSGQTHWDVEFIFRFELGREELVPTAAWKELDFIDYESSWSDIARSHEDILRSSGL
ncbi:MAG: hypothetical protein ACYC7D_12745 [Nitrososphaerales archaeon]